jgi:hypothetical protein
MASGDMELIKPIEVRPTDKALLIEHGEGTRVRGWFPRKALYYKDGKTLVKSWFVKMVANGKPTITKTELVNRFERKRKIVIDGGDNVDHLLSASEQLLQCIAEYRKGAINSSTALSEATDELAHWVEETKKGREKKPEQAKEKEPKFYGNVDKVIETVTKGN